MYQEAQAYQTPDEEKHLDLASGEEQFIQMCGELTRQQEAFIEKLKANPDISLDELRDEPRNDAHIHSAKTSVPQSNSKMG